MCDYIALIDPPPAPSACFMQPVDPDLPQRMLNEFSESPVSTIRDGGAMFVWQNARGEGESVSNTAIPLLGFTDSKSVYLCLEF